MRRRTKAILAHNVSISPKLVLEYRKHGERLKRRAGQESSFNGIFGCANPSLHGQAQPRTRRST
eukprot:scaffold1033_cov171-Amphora_coffeaeformis.AAC.17